MAQLQLTDMEDKGLFVSTVQRDDGVYETLVIVSNPDNLEEQYFFEIYEAPDEDTAVINHFYYTYSQLDAIYHGDY